MKDHLNKINLQKLLKKKKFGDAQGIHLIQPDIFPSSHSLGANSVFDPTRN